MIGGDGGRGILNAGQSPKYFYKPNKRKSVFSALFFIFIFWLLLLHNAALDLTVIHSLYGCLQIGLLVPACGGSYSGGNYWGNYISVRKVRLLSTTQNVIFGDFCFIRFTKMPLCFNLDCRIWSLLTLLSKEIPLIAKTSTYLITSFQMEKIRILVYFVLACTPVCWNSIIDNYYAYWLPIPCQSFVHKVSCNLYTSNDKWDNKGEFRAKMVFLHPHGRRDYQPQSP